MANRRSAQFRAAFWIAILFAPGFVRADPPPATEPAAAVKTGAFDIAFTQRSSTSSPKELARRLNLKPADVAKDYDLSKFPYKIYVPTNYDPATPCGIFVYLGYKDSVSTPPLWNAALEQAHLIFITPVAHTGSHYPNPIPLWQSVGLAMDAIYNLKQQYAIDDHRIYLMILTENGLRDALALGDIFTGLVVDSDFDYFNNIEAPQGGWYWKPDFAPPPGDLLSQDRKRAYIMADGGDANSIEHIKRIVGAMKHDGFEHVTQASLDLMVDLHYPMFKVEWLQRKVLPILDAAAAAQTSLPDAANADSPAAAPTSPSSQPAADEPSPAQQMLSLAQLYIANGQTDLAKTKLQEVIDTYPTDPAADKAKDLLQQLNNQ
jgi:hypothetical protein